MSALTLHPGFKEDERPIVAEAFWQAFQGKLGRIMGPEPKAQSFLTEVLNPRFALSARDAQGVLLGVAGFKTADGALVGGGLREMARYYGWFGGTLRGLILSVLERDVEPDVLLMDGIFVLGHARGRGVGTQLLNGIKAEAARLGLSAVRLDVIDSNPRARALYEREGFTPTGSVSTGPFRPIFGFRTATTMTCKVPAQCRIAAD